MNGWLDTLLDSAWEDVWKLAASWYEVLSSGWPIFALMGLCSKKLRMAQEDGMSEHLDDHLERFWMSLEEHATLPLPALEKALRSPSVVDSAFAKATTCLGSLGSLRNIMKHI